MLRLTLFGKMRVEGPMGAIDLGGGKVSALLAYLALAGARPVSREKVGELLWGSAVEEQSRQSVRQALSRLRKALGADVLSSDGPMLALERAAVACDVLEFESFVTVPDAQHLKSALALKGGRLLEGCDITEPGFSNWLEHERRRLDDLAAMAALRLGQAELRRDDPAEALLRADDLLAADSLSEAAHRLRLAALAALGRRGEALRLHDEFTARLLREMGIAPEVETEKLVLGLRNHDGAVVAKPDRRHASIAVMPFANIGAAPEEDYFAEGIVEEIIIALSRVRGLQVSTRSATFALRGKTLNAREAGRLLDVAYVLEGTVRKSAGRLRIACQLADVTTGQSLWAERFEGSLEDVFALQDQVTARVASSVVPTVERAELDHSRSKPTANLSAYDHYLRGLAEVHRWTKEANAAGLRHFYRAIELDRQYGAAYGMAARCFSQRKTTPAGPGRGRGPCTAGGAVWAR